MSYFFLAKCFPLWDSLISSPPAVMLFDQSFVRQILLVRTDALGMNEKQAPWKGQESNEKYENLSPVFARILLCDIWNVLWIIHGWPVTVEWRVPTTACSPKCQVPRSDHQRNRNLRCLLHITLLAVLYLSRLEAYPACYVFANIFPQLTTLFFFDWFHTHQRAIGFHSLQRSVKITSRRLLSDVSQL